MLVHLRFALAVLRPDLKLLLFEGNERIGGVGSRHLLGELSELGHSLSNKHGDLGFFLYVRDNRHPFRAIRTEDLSLNLLFGLEPHVIENVFSKNRRAQGVTLDDWRHALDQVAHHVCVMLLPSKGSQVLAINGVCVLASRVLRTRMQRVIRLQQHVNILGAQGFVHAAVGLIQVVDLRCALSKLKLRLSHRDLLSGRENVWISNWDDIHPVVKVFFEHLAVTADNVKRVLGREILAKALSHQLKLELLGIVEALVDTRHDHCATLKQGNRRSHSGLLVTITDL